MKETVIPRHKNCSRLRLRIAGAPALGTFHHRLRDEFAAGARWRSQTLPTDAKFKKLQQTLESSDTLKCAPIQPDIGCNAVQSGLKWWQQRSSPKQSPKQPKSVRSRQRQKGSNVNRE